MPTPHRRRVTAVALVCAWVLSGCDDGQDPPQTADGGATEEAPADAPGSSTAAPAAPVYAVSGRSLDGGEIDLGDLRGRAAALWLWTPW
ncbi:hypothetical protein [Egicoccus halophilus]|uniref:hypothetical protein n=1 Tax=Egicoccus halophilus TaxID=1670830 RepID=UPI00102FD46E|nr:hypothetical protein [Egicoccus halophilus]